MSTSQKDTEKLQNMANGARSLQHTLDMADAAGTGQTQDARDLAGPMAILRARANGITDPEALRAMSRAARAARNA